MSRFDDDYYDEEFPNQSALWWANVQRALKGRKGQRVLRDLREAMLDLPAPRLIDGRLANEDGEVCAVGALALKRRVDKGEDRGEVLRDLAAKIGEDEYNGADITATVGVSVGVTYNLAYQLAYVNDGDEGQYTPEQRFSLVLKWLDAQIAVTA